MTDFLLLAFIFLVAGALSVPVATRPDPLHSAGIERAKRLVIAIDKRAQIT